MKTFLVAGAVAVLALGCEKKEEPPKTTPTAAPTTSAATTTSAAAPTTVVIDPEIQKKVQAIVTGCQVDEKYLSVSGCKNSEDYAVIEYAAQKKISNTFESLAEIALTEGAKDKKVLAAVVGTWNTFKDPELQKQNSTPAAAERVLKLYEQVPDDHRRFADAAAIPLLAGKREQLTALVKKRPAKSDLKTSTITNYLRWGGAGALADAKDFLKNATTDDEKYSAVWGVGVAAFDPKLPEADKTKMCDWAKEVASDASLSARVFGAAVDSLGRCKGPYIDHALTVIEARIAKEKMSEPVANGLHHMCWAEGVIGGTVNGTQPQCEKALALLIKGAEDKDTPPAAASQAVWAIEMLGKNGGQEKKAKEALDKLSNHKEKQVADKAKSSRKNLK
jgi:hypothetical protein